MAKKGHESNTPFNWSKLLSLLVAIVIHGNLWFWLNIYYGNLALLNVLGWVAFFPWFLRLLLAIFPSAGQYYYEEKREEQEAMAKLLRAGKITKEQYDACKMDWQTVAFIAVCSTFLDLMAPAMGIVISIQQQGGKIGLVWAVGLAFLTSWGSQRFLRKSIKEALSMIVPPLKAAFWRAVRGKKAGKKEKERPADASVAGPVYEPIQLTLGDRK